MSKRKSKYPGTEAALYLIVSVVCGLCLAQLKAFSNFKKRYTKEYIDDILASLKIAEAMPSISGRQGKQKSQRTTLQKLNQELCSLFQKLMLYMEAGFDESLWLEKRMAAGGDQYEAAKGNNWKASKTMQELAIAFMNDYAAELAAGDMPANFAADFAEKNGVFLATLVDYGTSKNTTVEDTADKLDANNALYTRIQTVMKDGRRIFEGDEVMMEQFSYMAQLRKWGGMGDTGFRFSLKEADTLVPVTTASVSFLPSGLDFSMEEEETGVILVYLPELKKDELYSYLLTAPGYEEMAGTLVATTGVMHRVDLILKKAAMSVDPSSGDVKKFG